MTDIADSSQGNLFAQAARLREQLTAPGAPFELVQVESRGRRLPAYRNAPASLPALIDAGRAHGEREFMVYEGERWSFARFFAAVDALAGRLQAEQGLRRGDVVALAMRNRPEWAVAFAAVALVGALPAPLNSFGLREELLANLDDLGARWLICDAQRHERIATDLGARACRAVVVDGAPAEPGDRKSVV